MSLHRTIVPAEVDEDEEPVDPKIAIDEKCSKTTACSKAFVEYEACAERIEKKGHGECSGQYMDYLACIDACVRRSLCCARAILRHAIFAPRNFCAAQFCAAQFLRLARPLHAASPSPPPPSPPLPSLLTAALAPAQI